MITLADIKSITIEATSFCNLHCPQCNRFNQEGFLADNFNEAHLNFDNFAKNFDLNKLPNLQKIIFEGDHGDFLMHPDADKFLEFFANITGIQIITNGSLRSTKWWASLASQKNLKVVFSIDGLRDTNAIYRINSNYDKIINNAKIFIDHGGHATWKFIVFEHNQHQIDQAQEFALSMGFKEFVAIHTSRSWWTGNTWPVKVNGVYQYDLRPSNLVTKLPRQEFTIALDTLSKIKINQVTNNVNQNQNTLSRPKCWLDRGAMYVNHKGHFLPCCMVSGKLWKKDILSQLWQRIVGDATAIDLNYTNIEQIITSDFYQNQLEKSWQHAQTIHSACIQCMPWSHNSKQFRKKQKKI